MSQRYYFLLSHLPALPELGGAPVIQPAELRRHAQADRPAGEVVDAILLEQDLLSREAALAGEIADPQPVVLSPEQVRGEQPLPAALAAPEGPRRRIPADLTWEAYYRHVRRLGERCRCGFLRQWVGFEVALRNALAAERARALELEPADYLLAADLADPSAGAEDIVRAWSAARDPLRALRVLDEARAGWTGRRSRYFSFSLDEVAAYARMLSLVVRWHRLGGEEGQTESNQAA